MRLSIVKSNSSLRDESTLPKCVLHNTLTCCRKTK